MITKRQVKILELIIKNYTGITGSNIADILNVSTRTIRNDISAINNEFKDTEYKINSCRKKGYFIDVEILDKLKELIFSNDVVNVSYEESLDRMFKILGQVLFEGKKSIFDLAEILFISDQTVYKECKKLRKILAEKQNFSYIEISGDYVFNTANENKCRELLFKILKELILSNKVTYINDIGKLLNNNFHENEYRLLYIKIKKFIVKNNNIIDDKSLEMIVGAIYISIIRNRKGLFVELVEEKSEIKNYDFILSLLLELNSYGFELDKRDISSLSRFLWCIKIYEGNNTNDSVSNITGTIVNEFCKDVMDKYSFDLKESKEIMDYMMTHIEYMVRRIDTGYELSNPMIEDIKRKYTFAYEIAMLIVPIVYKYKNKYTLDDEISYIAVYVEYYLQNINNKIKTVIITDSSMGVNSIVRSWLCSNFTNQLQVIDYISVHSLESYLTKNKIDLIVSVRELAGDINIPNYIIENIPDKNDYALLSNIIHKIKVGYKYENIVKRMFSEGYIHFYDGSKNFNEIIKEMAKTLEDGKCIKDTTEFSNDVIEREKYYPTTMGRQFAIPHPLAVFANKTTVSVAILNKPITHNKKELKLIFLLAIENKLDDDVNTLFQVLKQIAVDKNALRQLSEVNNKEQFLTNLIYIIKNKQ